MLVLQALRQAPDGLTPRELRRAIGPVTVADISRALELLDALVRR